MISFLHIYLDEVREMLIKLNKNKSSYENKRSSSSNDDKDSNDEYIDENIYKSSNKFGNDFDDHYYHNCDGCLEAAVIQYLLRNRTWTYSRLAIDGLKSVVFHNPSPTWCIASANIWYVDDDDSDYDDSDYDDSDYDDSDDGDDNDGDDYNANDNASDYVDDDDGVDDDDDDNNNSDDGNNADHDDNFTLPSILGLIFLIMKKQVVYEGM